MKDMVVYINLMLKYVRSS